MKSKYLGARGNPISAALERVQSLSSLVLTYPNAAILLLSPLQCNVAVYPVWHNVLRMLFFLHHLLDRFKKEVLLSSRINLM